MKKWLQTESGSQTGAFTLSFKDQSDHNLCFYTCEITIVQAGYGIGIFRKFSAVFAYIIIVVIVAAVVVVVVIIDDVIVLSALGRAGDIEALK